MSFVLVENLESGSMLDQDVQDINGRLLLSKGQTLNDKHIRILRIWGVTEVQIVDNPHDAASDHEEIDLQKMEEVKAVVQLLFSKLDSDIPAINQVMQCAITHRFDNDMVPVDGEASGESDALPDKLDAIDIRRKMKTDTLKLPAAPTIVVRLNKVLADPLASANDVAQIVSTSPSLTALMLKIVNSAAFGLPNKVDRISRAVSLLGTRLISSLAIGVSVVQAFRDVPRNVIDMTSFLIHSLSCATITRILAALANIHNTEQLYIAGLLHDVGKLILFKYFPEHARTLFRQARRHAGMFSVYELEKTTIGKSHTRLASQLLNHWNFPASLQNNIIHHHSPSRAKKPEEAAIVQMADMITHGLGFGSSGELIIPSFDSESWDKLAISPSTVKMTIRQATHQLQTIKSILT